MGLVDSFMRRYRSMSPWLIVFTFAALILSQQRSSSSSSSSPTCSKKKGLSHGSTALTSPRNPALASRAHSENCHQGPMKLAIYQGRWYHSEVFGTFIDHANECGHTLTIYYEDGHATSAVPLYIQLYADKFVVRNPSHFLAEQHEYDAVIFTTPDDIPDEGLQKRNAHRFIYTIHLLEPAYAKNWHLLRIHMSTVVSWPFVVPVYDGGDKIAPAATRKKEIMMLGTLWDGENYDIAQVYKLAELLEPHGWTLVAYTRHWGSAKGKVADPPKNMRLEMSKGTVEVFEYAKKVSYIIIWPSSNSWYLVDRLTGSLPFAMSVGTPVITSSAFASVYGLHEGRGALVAPDVEGIVEQLVGKNEKGAPLMTPERHQAMFDTLYSYREQVRGQNTRTLDSLFSAIPGSTQVQPLVLPNPLVRFYK